MLLKQGEREKNCVEERVVVKEMRGDGGEKNEGQKCTGDVKEKAIKRKERNCFNIKILSRISYD